MLLWRTRRRAEARRYTPSLLLSVSIDGDTVIESEEYESPHELCDALADQLLGTQTPSLPIVLRILDAVEDHDMGTHTVLKATHTCIQYIQQQYNNTQHHVILPILLRLLEYAPIVRQAADNALDGWTQYFPDLAFDPYTKQRTQSHLEHILSLIIYITHRQIQVNKDNQELQDSGRKLIKAIRNSICANLEDYSLPWRTLGQIHWDTHTDAGRALFQAFRILVAKGEKYYTAALMLSKKVIMYGGVLDYSAYSIEVSEKSQVLRDMVSAKAFMLKGLKYLAEKNPGEIDEKYVAHLRRFFPSFNRITREELNEFCDQEIFRFSQRGNSTYVEPHLLRLSILLKRPDAFARLLAIPFNILLTWNTTEQGGEHRTWKRRKINDHIGRFELMYDEHLPFILGSRALYELRQFSFPFIPDFIRSSRDLFLQMSKRVYARLTDSHFRSLLMFWTCLDSEPEGVAVFSVNPDICTKICLLELWTRPDQLLSSLLNGHETTCFTVTGAYKKHGVLSEHLALALAIAKERTISWLRVFEDTSECSRNAFMLWLRVLFSIFRCQGMSSGAPVLHFLSELCNTFERTIPNLYQAIHSQLLSKRTHNNNVSFEEVKSLGRGRSTSVLGVSAHIVSDADVLILGFRPLLPLPTSDVPVSDQENIELGNHSTFTQKMSHRAD